MIADLAAWAVFSPRAADVLEAIAIENRHEIGFWDAMIVRAGTALGASVIWSEDLTDGHVYEGVVVRNPFAGRKN